MVTPSYIPADAQTDDVARARAQELGVGVAPREVPPVYERVVTQLPGVVAEWNGSAVFAHDDGLLSRDDIAALVEPLAEQRRAREQAVENEAASLDLIDQALALNATFLENPVDRGVQVVALTKQMNAVLRLLLGRHEA